MGTHVKLVHAILQKAMPEVRGIDLKYLDVGAQELYGGDASEYAAFFAWARREGAVDAGLRDRCYDLARRSEHRWNPITDGAPRTTVGELFGILGWQYQSIDVLGGTLALDLNYAALDPALLGRFDVVANFGTTEHVFNQLACFRLIHDATRVGGVMIHFLPTSGYFYHCLFKYDPKMFVLLREANGYEVLHAGFGGREGHSQIGEGHESWANYPDMHAEVIPNRLIKFVFRKTKRHPFQVPYDKDTKPGYRISEDYQPLA